MRRILRSLAIAFAGIMVIGLAAYLAFSVYATQTLRSAKRGYEAAFDRVALADLQPFEPKREQNAATWLSAGAAAVVEVTADSLPSRLARTSADEWSPSERQDALTTIEANRPAFELFERALACTASSFGIQYVDGVYARLPDFLELLNGHRLVLIRTRLALADGDPEAAAAGLELMAAFSEALAKESLLITATIAISMDLGYLDATREALERGLGDSAWLTRVEENLLRMNRRDLLWRALRAEGAVAEAMAMTTMESAWGSPVIPRLGRPALRLMKAGFLRAPVDAASRLDTPFADWTASSEPDVQPLSWQGSISIYPHLMISIGKQQAHEAVRQLALEATRLRRAGLAKSSYPADNRLPAADPLSGSAYQRTDDENGSVVLSAPRAKELFQSSIRTRPSFEEVFLWELPPLP